MTNAVTNTLPVIESDIPVPVAASTRTRSNAYAPLPQLEVGQSIFVAGKKLSTVKIYLSSTVIKALRDAGRKHAAAEAQKDDVDGVRIWRTA